MQRTEDQVLSQSPIVVTLGTKQYNIKPLRINKAREWRQKLVNEVNSISSEMRKETGSDQAFLQGLGFTLLRFPEKMVNLVKEFAPDLDWTTIEEEATEEQLAAAFGNIMELAFPFQGELRKLTLVLGAAAATSQQ